MNYKGKRRVKVNDENAILMKLQRPKTVMKTDCREFRNLFFSKNGDLEIGIIKTINISQTVKTMDSGSLRGTS